jgi:hypothetical protein
MKYFRPNVLPSDAPNPTVASNLECCMHVCIVLKVFNLKVRGNLFRILRNESE